MRNFKLLSVLLLCMAVVFTSCGTWNNTAGGAAVGAGVGALAGNTALGSIIGAAVGGTAGALIGKKMDKQLVGKHIRSSGIKVATLLSQIND